MCGWGGSSSPVTKHRPTTSPESEGAAAVRSCPAAPPGQAERGAFCALQAFRFRGRCGGRWQGPRVSSCVMANSAFFAQEKREPKAHVSSLHMKVSQGPCFLTRRLKHGTASDHVSEFTAVCSVNALTGLSSPRLFFFYMFIFNYFKSCRDSVVLTVPIVCFTAWEVKMAPVCDHGAAFPARNVPRTFTCKPWASPVGRQRPAPAASGPGGGSQTPRSLAELRNPPESWTCPGALPIAGLPVQLFPKAVTGRAAGVGREKHRAKTGPRREAPRARGAPGRMGAGTVSPGNQNVLVPVGVQLGPGCC